MKLYIHPMSSNARRAQMTAILLGLQPEYVVVDLAKRAQRDPAYLALNPNGKVPTLVDGDVVVWESIAIMTYLADKTPGQTLYPTDLVERTHIDKWLFWAAAHWGPSVGGLTYEYFLKKVFGQGEPNDYAVTRSLAFFKDLASVLDVRLTTSPYVGGAHLTLADLAIAAPLMYAGPAKLPVNDYPSVARWFTELKTLDAWKQTEPPAMG